VNRPFSAVIQKRYNNRAAVGQPLQPFRHAEKAMRIHNLYADENGETHFRDIEIEFTETGPDFITLLGGAAAWPVTAECGRDGSRVAHATIARSS
jgi:hypothetical protein